MVIEAALLHRYAVAIPDRAQLEEEENWYQAAQVVIVIAAAFLSSFALVYSAFTLESSIVGVCSVIVIIAGATQLWDYCSEWVRKHHKAIEIATIFESLRSEDYDSATHRILAARIRYFEKCCLTFNTALKVLMEKKENFKKVEAPNTHEFSKQIYDFNVQIYEQKKLAAIARIKIAWLNVLINHPDFQGDLSDLCYYCENEKFDEYCIDQCLALEVPYADAFLFFNKEIFENKENPLTIHEILEMDLETLRDKLYNDHREA